MTKRLIAGLLTLCMVFSLLPLSVFADEAPSAESAVQAEATGETPAAGTETPATGTETPATGTETPATGTETPASSTETPASGTETPATGTETPATGTETPATGTETPATGTETPATGTETPATTDEQAAMMPITPAAATDPVYFTVTFNPNGGAFSAGETGTRSVEAGSTVANAPVAVREDHTFTGWNTQADGAGGTLGTVNGDMTVYAQWIKTKNYTISYDPNGGVLANTNHGSRWNHTQGNNTFSNINGKNNSLNPTREGYTFLGWGTTQTALTYPKNVSAPITLDENQTILVLYAIWELNEVTTEEYSLLVVTDPAGGLTTGSAGKLAAGTEVSISASAPALPGDAAEGSWYEFTGWTTSVEGVTVTGGEKDGAVVMPAQDLVVTANYVLKTPVPAVTYPVHLLIYRNGDTATPVKDVYLGEVAAGTEFDLSGMEETLAANYTSPNGYEHGPFSNDGWWPLGSTVTINGWTNIKVMVTDYEQVVVIGTEDFDRTTQWTIWSGKALHGTNLLEFLAAQNISLAKDGYVHDEWFNYDWEGHKFDDSKVINGWTNVQVNYTAHPPVYVHVYRNGDLSQPVASKLLGTYAKGTVYRDILTEHGYLNSLEGLYTMSQGAADYRWNGIWSHEASNIPADMVDGTVDGWTNLCTMVYDSYPVYANVYRDGSISEAVAVKYLGNYKFGTSFASILAEHGLLNSIDSLYTKNKNADHYEWDGIWSHEASNIPANMVNGAVSGWTNLCTMAYDAYAVNYHIGASNEHVKVDYITARTVADYALYQPAEKEGYSFDGWYEKRADIGNPNKKTSAPLFLKKWELYGQYNCDEVYTLTFDKNTKANVFRMPGAMEEAPEDGAADFRIPTAKPYRPGYTFKGWNTKKDGSGEWATRGKDFTVDTVDKMNGPDEVLYAIWKLNTGDNPKTGDNIKSVVTVMVIAGIGLVAVAVYSVLKKKK